MKSDLYLGAGVAEVWLIDPRAQSIEIRAVTGARVVTGARSAASEVISGFEMSSDELFCSTE